MPKGNGDLVRTMRMAEDLCAEDLAGLINHCRELFANREHMRHRLFSAITIERLEAKIDQKMKELLVDQPIEVVNTSDIDINFDCETYFFTKEESLMGARLGYFSLSSGLTCLGCIAGGEWEIPVYHIVYWDGRTLRGYVPKKGNVFNHETKQAFGNNDEADNKDYKRQYPELDDGEEYEYFDELRVNLDIQQDEIESELINVFRLNKE